jgi:hypothetical protein
MSTIGETNPGDTMSMAFRNTRFVVAVAAIGAAWACSSDDKSIVAPPDETVKMCRTAAAPGTIVDVPVSNLASRSAQGDYVSSLVVDPASTRVGDSVHFKRITDAVAVVRAIRQKRNESASAGCIITINVAAGVYRGSTKDSPDATLEKFPILLDMPGVKLQGALAMALDASFRANGAAPGSGVSTLTPIAGLATDPAPEAIFVVDGHPDGSAGNDVTIEGFALQSGHVGVDADTGGFGVFALRVKNLVVRGNRFESALTSAIDVRATDAQIENNTIGGGGLACDVCLAGPGSFMVSGNRISKGGIDGVVLSSLIILPVPAGVEQYTLPATASASATVVNNDIRDHLRLPVGVAVRVSAIGTGAPNVPQSATLDIRDNTLANNTFALLFEAGFPLANTTLKGDLAVTLARNTIQSSCQADLLVSFNRHATTLGVAQLTRPYIRNSTYNISLGGNLRWEDVWYSNPPGLGNLLLVDGVAVDPGSRLSYVPTKVCG